MVGCDRQGGSLPQGTNCYCGATNWSRHSGPSSGFSALMPMQPTSSIVTNRTAAGSVVVTMLTSEVSRTVAFTLLQNSFPTNLPTSDSERLYSIGLKSALGDDGHLISERTVRLNGSAGREWRFDKHRGRAVITMRAHLVRHEFYQAICVMPKDHVCERHISDFLESCQLERK